MPDFAIVTNRSGNTVKIRASSRRNTVRETRSRPLEQNGASSGQERHTRPSEESTSQDVAEQRGNALESGILGEKASMTTETESERQGNEVPPQASRRSTRSTRSTPASLAAANLRTSTNAAAIGDNTSNTSLNIPSAATKKILTSTSQSDNKRKKTPRPSPAVILAQGTASTTAVTSAVKSNTVRPERATSTAISQQTPSNDELLRNVTSGLASISNLAAEIDGTARPRRKTGTMKPRAQETVEGGNDAQSEAGTEAEQDASARPAKRKRQKRSMADVAAAVVAEATGQDNSRRMRTQTPDDAEDHEIEPSKVTMGDLCEPTNLGKKSMTERAMQNVDWDEVKKQWKEEADKAHQLKMAGKKPEKRTTAQGETVSTEPVTQLVPSTMVVNGEIVFAEETRHVDRQQDIENIASNESRIIVTDDRITKRVNSSTVGAPRGLQNARKNWDAESTERFYKGLRMFGTDFMMISHMFPYLTRRHIKLKYVKEEKTNLAKIRENLAEANREPVDLKAFEEENDKVFEDPKKVEEELKAEEKRLREEDEKRREMEKAGRHPEEADEGQENREQGSADPESDIVETVEGDDTNPSRNRFASIAEGIVSQALAPRKKQQRKADAAKKKPASKKLQKAMEGTVEILGTVQDVPM